MRVTAEFRNRLYGLDVIIADVAACKLGLWKRNICRFSNRCSLVPLFYIAINTAASEFGRYAAGAI